MARKWTEEQLQIIREQLQAIGIRGLARKLEIPASTIRRKVAELELPYKSLEPTTPFTPVMDSWLRLLYGNWGLTQNEIADIFELSLQQVNRRVQTLRIAKIGLKRFGHAWNEEEINFLTENYPYESAEYLSRVLNRPAHSIRKKAEELGLVIVERERERRVKKVNPMLADRVRLKEWVRREISEQRMVYSAQPPAPL